MWLSLVWLPTRQWDSYAHLPGAQARNPVVGTYTEIALDHNIFILVALSRDGTRGYRIRSVPLRRRGCLHGCLRISHFDSPRCHPRI